MSTRIVQISDCHLFTDPAEELRGVQPHQAVLAALQHVTEHEGNADYLVISGDLAHDELRPTVVSRLNRALLGLLVAHVRVGAGGRDAEGRCERPDQGEVFFEHGRLVNHHVRAAGGEALVVGHVRPRHCRQ